MAGHRLFTPGGRAQAVYMLMIIRQTIPWRSDSSEAYLVVEVWQGLALDELTCRQVGRGAKKAPACKVGGRKEKQRLQHGRGRGEEGKRGRACSM